MTLVPPVDLWDQSAQPLSTFFTNFTWSEGATISAALIAAIVVVIGYSRQQRAARRERRATMYAEALRAVEDYLEAPYLIRRRDGSAEARRQITDHISDVQSRINFYTGWLTIHAPTKVTGTYEAFVRAARQDAGPQMTAAWEGKPTRKDRDVPVRQAYDRARAYASRSLVLAAMKDDLSRR